MDEERELADIAIDVAIERTAAAQQRAEREILESGAPAIPTAETAVRRAEDLHVLVDDAEGDVLT